MTINASQELLDALATKGYSGLPQSFKYKLVSGEIFDRQTRFTQQFVDESFVPQVLAVVETLERAPLPSNIQKYQPAGAQDITVVVESAWAEDENGTHVKDFDPATIKIANDEWPLS